MRALSAAALAALTAAALSFTGTGILDAATGSDMAGADSVYAGQQARAIKALSPQQIDDYLNGRGMGYAKPAELNHYPGPRHVLDLANELELSGQQIRKSQGLFAAMKSTAVDLGKQLVELEQQLDRQFASKSAEEHSLRLLLMEIGALEARLRFVHLSAHVKQKALLTTHQVRLYDQLRGYGAAAGNGHTHAH